MAAALSFCACSSSEDSVTEEKPAAQTVTKIHVTVGAGISDGDGQTRATVEQTGTTRKLKFSAGDKLWVYRQKSQGGNMYVFAGTLAIGTIGTDGTTAQFSGDLSVYKSNSSAPDPDLSSLEGFMAVLIPAGSTCIKAEMDQFYGQELMTYEEKGVATGALNDLMAKNTYVRGLFADASNVTLNASTAFFNCTVTGLDNETAYDVRAGNTGEPVSITSDGEGNLHFLAWYHLEDEDEYGRAFEYTSDLRFVIGTNKCARLSGKSLYAKVYNMTRAAEPYTPFTITYNTTGNPVEPQNGRYNFNDDADITVSGENEGEYIRLYGDNDRVVMRGVTATCFQPFIHKQEGTLNVELSGANSITNPNSYDGDGDIAINCNGTLYLSGNGTLTVTAYGNSLYGIHADNYHSGNNSDPSALAADGYTVTRSDMTDNGDGTYTWTYTVGPIVDLSELKGDYTAQDGQTLTGALSTPHKISIADGATVTLSNMSINGNNTYEYGLYPGITCEGSATIILVGDNFVQGYEPESSGIFVPEGKTLIIRGDGSLTAYSGCYDEKTGGSAGIGGCHFVNCGNIEIQGGTITASGVASGIGSGTAAYCGDITISGGTVTASSWSGPPAIGGNCGDITITDGITSVTAQINSIFVYIGSNISGSTMTIDGVTSFSYETSTKQFPHLISTLSRSSYSYNTWTLTKKPVGSEVHGGNSINSWDNGGVSNEIIE